MNNVSRRDFLAKSSQIAGAVVAANAGGSRLSFAAGGRKVKLNVGYLPICDHLILPVSHALHNDGYKDLSIRPYLCRSWDQMTKRVEMGVLQAAFLLTPLAMHKVTTGSSLRCVLLGHKDGSVIATEKSIGDAKGLVGKRIGLPHPNSTHRVLLYKYLHANGVNMKDDVELTTVAPPLTVKTLKAGRIDAYSVAEPWGMRGVNEGAARILEYSKNIFPDHVCCIVMVKKEVIERAPGAVSEWVRSLQDAGRYIHANVDEAAALQRTYMKHRPEEISQVIRQEMISYTSLRPDRESLGAMHDLAMESGVLPKKCDLAEFVDDRFAQST